MADRLVREFDNYAEEDLLLQLMTHVEQQLREAGAKPGKDYTYGQLAEWTIRLSAAGTLAKAVNRLADATDNLATSVLSNR